MPVNDIQRAVRPEFKLDRTEVWIIGKDQVLPQFARKACTVFDHCMLLGTQEPNRIVHKIIALHLIWKMAR